MKAIILEGARGTGKTTLAHLIRQQTEGTTLINLTGFKENHKKGLTKITKYYTALLRYIQCLKGHDSWFIFDRIFFSEIVYAPFYKKYNFEKEYNYFSRQFVKHIDEAHVFLLTIDNQIELGKRLSREKEILFGQVEESVKNSMKQQERYIHVINYFKEQNKSEKHIHVHQLKTDNQSPDELKNIILQKAAI